MRGTRVFITSMGIISPVGQGMDETINAIRRGTSGIKPLRLFKTSHKPPLPAGVIDSFMSTENVPRTHALALIAAEEAMKNAGMAPDAVVIGVTTGGMSVTEELLKRGDADPRHYTNHSTCSVSEYIARHVRCKGPVLTISTACSSGAVALKIALEMLRRGKARQVLAGGADALCRLTYYGFHSLQLVDAKGARPFDRERCGMSVGEGSAMLLLTAAEIPPDNAIAELLGAGLSCDAHHPASPHPEGSGAVRAMENALSDAQISHEEIDYIHLHGTGTIDNDLAEARAINALFGGRPLPRLSSMKGAMGHSLAGAGAMGAVVSALSISEGIIPANTGFLDPDPELNLIPVDVPISGKVNAALANSFGFGGNNAVIVMGNPKGRMNPKPSFDSVLPAASFNILGCACLTGAGNAKRTIECMAHGEVLKGAVPSSDILEPFSEKYVRRLKRLPRMVLSLAVSACESNPEEGSPASVFLGTGWGGLSETHDFLTKLFASDERFTSPTDFIGSVHNASAGHVAIHYQSTGPNVTATGGDCSFEQALFTAGLLSQQSTDPVIVIGADEYHERLSPLFDSSVAQAPTPSDGGGALYLKRSNSSPSSVKIHAVFMAYSENNEQTIPEAISQLGGGRRIEERFGALWAGIPASQRRKGRGQLNQFLSMTKYPHPVIDYRQFVGEYASASAVANVLAVMFVQTGEIPGNVAHTHPTPLLGRGILVMGFGNHVTAVEIMP